MKSKSELKDTIEQKRLILLDLTSEFCKKKLNDDYRSRCEYTINKMARKRAVPFLSGKIESWAAAIIHVLGKVNFLFDKNTKPYVRADEIADYFKVGKSTVSYKASQLTDIFDMHHLSSEFLTDEMAERYANIFEPFLEIMEDD